MLFNSLFLRDFLFDLSVEHSKILRRDYSSKILDLLCKILSEMGDKYAVAVILGLSYNILPTEKSYTVFLTILTG